MDREPVVIVTGSSGLIGARVISRAPAGYQLVGFDNHGPPEPPIQAECIPVDLTDPENVVRGFERVRYAYGARIAAIIHLAAYYDFSGADSPLYQTLTVEGTSRLIGAVRSGGFRLEQFLFSSSMLVHAPCEPGQRIDENWPLDPKWHYPRSKVAAEQTIDEQRDDIPAVILRIAGVYDDECHSIPIAHQIQRIAERRLTARVFPGDITHGQAYVHLDDVVDAIWSAVQRRNALAGKTVLLIGEDETLSYDEMQRMLADLIHGESDWDTTSIAKPLAEIGAWIQDHIPLGEESFIKPWMIGLADDHYELDISRARRVLGWQPQHSLRATLPTMAHFLKSDPAAFYRKNKLAGSPLEVASERDG